jgi:hypothetical protein
MYKCGAWRKLDARSILQTACATPPDGNWSGASTANYREHFAAGQPPAAWIALAISSIFDYIFVITNLGSLEWRAERTLG